MVTSALRYIISHPIEPVAIPGAESPEQAAMNASAGEKIWKDRPGSSWMKTIEK